jgi:hypothetical protein
MAIACSIGHILRVMTEKEETVAETEEHRSHNHAMPPPVMTEACRMYFEAHFGLLGFVGFVSELATNRDETSKIAARALYNVADDEADKERHKKVLDQGGVGATKLLRRYRQLLLELVVTRGADTWLLYVSELLATVFRSRPETLRSNEQVRLDAILQHSTMEELISDLAERKVQSLAYQGMREVAAWLQERLGLTLFDDGRGLDRAVRFVEVRNLIVHNRAVVNEIFRSRVPDHPAKLGEGLKFDVDDVFDDLEFLGMAVASIDERAVSKFHLEATVSRQDLRPLGPGGSPPND